MVRFLYFKDSPYCRMTAAIVSVYALADSLDHSEVTQLDIDVAVAVDWAYPLGWGSGGGTVKTRNQEGLYD